MPTIYSMTSQAPSSLLTLTTRYFRRSLLTGLVLTSVVVTTATYACQLPESYYKHVSCTSNDSYFLAVKDSGAPVALLNRQGQKVADLMRYTRVDANKLRNGVMPVQKAGKVGYINTQGREVVPAVYDSLANDSNTNGWARASHNNRIIVKKGGQFGVISTSNQVILAFSSRYRNIQDFKNGVAQIEQGSGSSWIATNGQAVANPNAPAPAVNVNRNTDNKNDASNTINNTNRTRTAVPNIPRRIDNEVWKLEQRDGKWGYINSEGTPMIRFEFDEAQPFSEGLAGVRVNNNWGFVDASGELVIPFRFSADGVITEENNNDDAETNDASYFGKPPFVFIKGKAWIGSLNDGTKLCIDKQGTNVTCDKPFKAVKVETTTSIVPRVQQPVDLSALQAPITIEQPTDSVEPATTGLSDIVTTIEPTKQEDKTLLLDIEPLVETVETKSNGDDSEVSPEAEPVVIAPTMTQKTNNSSSHFPRFSRTSRANQEVETGDKADNETESIAISEYVEEVGFDMPDSITPIEQNIDIEESPSTVIDGEVSTETEPVTIVPAATQKINSRSSHFPRFSRTSSVNQEVETGDKADNETESIAISESVEETDFNIPDSITPIEQNIDKESSSTGIDGEVSPETEPVTIVPAATQKINSRSSHFPRFSRTSSVNQEVETGDKADNETESIAISEPVEEVDFNIPDSITPTEQNIDKESSSTGIDGEVSPETEPVTIAPAATQKTNSRSSHFPRFSHTSRANQEVETGDKADNETESIAISESVEETDFNIPDSITPIEQNIDIENAPKVVEDLKVLTSEEETPLTEIPTTIESDDLPVNSVTSSATVKRIYKPAMNQSDTQTTETANLAPSETLLTTPVSLIDSVDTTSVAEEVRPPAPVATIKRSYQIKDSTTSP